MALSARTASQYQAFAVRFTGELHVNVAQAVPLPTEPDWLASTVPGDPELSLYNANLILLPLVELRYQDMLVHIPFVLPIW